MIKHAICGMAATVAALLAVPAQAAVIQVEHVFDISDITTGLNEIPLSSPFTAGVGDTIEFLVTFPSEITFEGESSLWLLALTSGSVAGIETAYSWEFLSPSSNLQPGPITGFQGNEQVHVGTYLSGSQYRVNSDPISFSGIRLTIDLLSTYPIDLDSDGFAETPAADPREYRTIALVLGNSAVPEPATWLLLISGIGVIGIALRRRRALVPAFA